MKRLQNLSISREFNINKQSEIKKFDGEIICIVDYFYRMLKQYSWKSPYGYIFIKLGSKEYEQLSGLYETGIKFDFMQFYKKDVLQRRKIILEILYNVFKKISNLHDLDIELIQYIYDKIVLSNFENKRLIRNKLFRSPSQKLFAGILLECEEKMSKVTFQLYDKDKKTILESNQLFEVPTFDLEILNYLKPKWIDNNTFTLHDESQEISFSKKVGNVRVIGG